MPAQVPHLVVDISGHGFGHAAQVAPVLNALAARRPALRLTVRSAVPADRLAEMIAPAVKHLPPPADVGMLMHDTMTIDVNATLAAYLGLHAHWPDVVAAERVRLATLAPTVLLSDCSYSSIAAAAGLGIPAVVMCSLNWADILAGYVEDTAMTVEGEEGNAPVARMLADIRACYRQAHVFLQLSPHMPMAWLKNRRPIGPVARRGRCRRTVLAAAAAAAGAVPADPRFVLVAFGGVGGLAPPVLPALAGVVWVTLGLGGVAADADTRIIDGGRLDLSVIDLMTSCDAVVTKPGYGTFVESACNGVRVLSLTRPDWPETHALTTWMEAHACHAEITPSTFRNPAALAVAVLALLARPVTPVAPDGVETAAGVVDGLLSRSGQGG